MADKDTEGDDDRRYFATNSDFENAVWDLDAISKLELESEKSGKFFIYWGSWHSFLYARHCPVPISSLLLTSNLLLSCHWCCKLNLPTFIFLFFPRDEWDANCVCWANYIDYSNSIIGWMNPVGFRPSIIHDGVQTVPIPDGSAGP